MSGVLPCRHVSGSRCRQRLLLDGGPESPAVSDERSVIEAGHVRARVYRTVRRRQQHRQLHLTGDRQISRMNGRGRPTSARYTVRHGFHDRAGKQVGWCAELGPERETERWPGECKLGYIRNTEHRSGLHGRACPLRALQLCCVLDGADCRSPRSSVPTRARLGGTAVPRRGHQWASVPLTTHADPRRPSEACCCAVSR